MTDPDCCALTQGPVFSSALELGTKPLLTGRGHGDVQLAMDGLPESCIHGTVGMPLASFPKSAGSPSLPPALPPSPTTPATSTFLTTSSTLNPPGPCLIEGGSSPAHPAAGPHLQQRY